MVYNDLFLCVSIEALDPEKPQLVDPDLYGTHSWYSPFVIHKPDSIHRKGEMRFYLGSK